MSNKEKKFAMACAICNISFENLTYALCGVSDSVYAEVRDSIIHNTRELLRQQPEDPLTERRTPHHIRVKVSGYTVYAQVWKSRLSGKPGRIRILKV